MVVSKLKIGRLTALTFLVLLPAASQALQQQIRFERISVEQGLSHAEVTAIIQDQSGFMWIGTADGLNKYDGYDFAVYKNIPTDPTSLSDNQIKMIAEDHYGNLWVGTRAGLNRLGRGQATFARYLHDPENATSIGSDEISVIFVDHEGVVWIGTPAGLDRYDHANDSFTRFQFDHNNLVDGIKQGPVVAIYEDRSNKLFLAMRDHTYGSLSSFDRATQSFVPEYGCVVKEHGDCNMQHTGDPYRPYGADINGLFQDETGAFWMATDSGATHEYRGYLSTYTEISGDPRSMSDYRVLAPVEDLSGQLWFATKGGGLNRMGSSRIVYAIDDERPDRYLIVSDDSWMSVFDRYQHDPDDDYSLSSDYLTTTYIDRFGVIWVGTSDAGLNKFDPAGMRFGYYKHDPLNPNSLSDNLVSAVAEESNGTLWLGTFRGALHKIDRADGKMTQYRHRNGDPNSLPDASIHALHVDRNDDLWLGTASGLSRFNNATGNFQNYNVYPVGPTVLGVLSITEDPAATLWLGTSATLARFDIATEEFRYFWPDLNDDGALHGDEFDVVRADKYGQIWVATADAGINRFDPETERVVHYRHDPNDLNSISDDHVTSIIEVDGNFSAGTGTGSVMLFGTRNGLDRFDQNNHFFVHYNRANGLPGNQIAGVAEDQRGDLWITTETSGLSRYDPNTDIFKNFDAIDGLQGNRFFDHVVHLTGSGEIIVGGINGINVFDPEKIIENTEVPAITVTNIQAGNSPIPTDSDDDRISLSQYEGELQFEFAALNFANPSRTEYAYKLEGYDDDWIPTASSNRVASYPNVIPGEYAFRIRAKLRNGDWGENYSSVSVSIAASVWQTNWAYASYGLLVTLGVFILMNVRANSLRRRADTLESKIAERTRQIEQNELLIRHQADHLEELLQVKEKLFTNISHEFRTPLTLILGPIQRMLRKTSDTDSAMQLNMVKENSQRLLRLVDQLLGLSRLSAEEPVTQSAQPLMPLVETIAESFQPLAEEKHIQLDVVDGEDLWVNCAPDALEKILLNLVSNAIKYTPAGGWVNVRVASADLDMVRLSVSDSGKGIDPKDHEAVFERFYRAKGGESSPGAGLGLALVKELAEAFGGSVRLESRLGLGTTVSVLLSRHRIRLSDIEAPTEKLDTGLIPLEVAASAHSNKSILTNGDGKSNGEASLLIVEDNLDMQAYLVSLLSDSYHCKVAADGEEGVRLAQENIPDLVLCDVMLPKMDGFEVSKTLKTSEVTSHIPIVMLTGRGDHDSRLKGLREQVDDYLTKPFNDEELMLRIANLLSVREILKHRYSRQLFDGSDVSQDLGQREQQFLDKLQAVLESNFSNSEFRVDQMSAAMAMSDRQLQRKLKALVDHSPAEYLRNYRLTMAIKKLKQGSQIGLVADAVGFSSQGYFASCFKAEFGATPSEFQRGLN